MAELIKAKKKKVKLKIGISAPSGGGKTLSALFIAYGMMKETYPTLTDDELWNKIAVIDTENESASLYAGDKRVGVQIGEFNVINLEPPYTPNEYVDAIRTCEENDIEVVVIDSLTHAWAGEGGLLDKQAKEAKKSGNSYTAWKDITPLHNRLVDTILQSNLHIIGTIRSKVEHIIDKDESGRTSIKKVGLAPIQREGMEYEFTTFFDLERDHTCRASKDRTGLFDDESFIVTPETGKNFIKWLSNAIEVKKEPKSELIKPIKKSLFDLKNEIKDILGTKTPEEKSILKENIENKNLPLNYNEIADLDILEMYLELVK